MRRPEMIQSQSRVAEEVVLLLLIAVGNQRALFLWPEEVMLLLPLMVAGNKATRCTSTAWPLAISPQVRVEEEEVVVASTAGKRAVTLLAHAMVCPMMMALLTGRGRRRKRKRLHGFE